MDDGSHVAATIAAPNESYAESVGREMRAFVASDMMVESLQVPREPKLEGTVVLRGQLLRPSHDVFPRWLTELNRRGFTPVLEHEDDEDSEESGRVVLRVMEGVARRAQPNIWINIVLFVLTVVSTLFVGSLYGDTGLEFDTLWDLLLPQNLIKGLPFALTLLSILTAHEFGHYFAAKYHNVAVTLPYFIPMPLGFGTLGAFIQMREPVPDQRKLFDIGVAGPIAGLILAVPLLIYGLSTSPVSIPDPSPGAMLEGNSLLYYYAKVAVFGKALPNALTGEDVLMNQVTFAAWIGLLVTALNLLPIGQLDGGHVVFALFGKHARYINMATAAVMLVLAIAGLAPLQELFPPLISVGFTGWFIWLGLLFFIIGPFHPPSLDGVTELDSNRRLIGYLIIVVFLLTFVPVPMRPL